MDKDLKKIVEALKAAGYQVVRAAAAALGGLHRRRGPGHHVRWHRQ